MTNQNISDKELDAARARLERTASELDELTVAKLRAMRKRAVAAAATRRPLSGWWLPLSTAAMATLVAVTTMTLWWRAPDPALVATEYVEWLATSENPDLFEDLEFYHWLEEEPDAG